MTCKMAVMQQLQKWNIQWLRDILAAFKREALCSFLAMSQLKLWK
jgi:hypothetical protein